MTYYYILRNKKRKVSNKNILNKNTDILYRGSLKSYEDPADLIQIKTIKGVILG